MSLYEIDRGSQPIVLPSHYAAAIATSLLAAEHFDRIPHHTECDTDASLAHPALLVHTDRQLLNHILSDIRIGASAETNGRPLTLRDFFDFLGHDDNLAQFSAQLDALSGHDAAASVDQINLIAKRLLQLHSICEIAREKALQSHPPHTHADVHAVHNRFGERLMQFYEQVRARVAIRFRHQLPTFEYGAQYFGLVQQVPDVASQPTDAVVSPLHLAGMGRGKPDLRVVGGRDAVAA